MLPSPHQQEVSVKDIYTQEHNVLCTAHFWHGHGEYQTIQNLPKAKTRNPGERGISSPREVGQPVERANNNFFLLPGQKSPWFPHTGWTSAKDQWLCFPTFALSKWSVLPVPPLSPCIRFVPCPYFTTADWVCISHGRQMGFQTGHANHKRM